MLILPSMQLFKAHSPGSLMVIALLGIIVVVLILPSVDLPDTAFQRNHSINVMRALSHPVSFASAHTDCLRSSSAIEDACIRAGRVQEIPDRPSNDLSIRHASLLC